MKQAHKRVLSVAALAAAIVGVTAAPALATLDATWTMTGVMNGFESQRRPSAGGNMTIGVNRSTCTITNVTQGGYFDLEMRRDVFGPDPSYGLNSYQCQYAYGWESHGWNTPAGQLYFTVRNINGTNVTTDGDWHSP